MRIFLLSAMFVACAVPTFCKAEEGPSTGHPAGPTRSARGAEQGELSGGGQTLAVDPTEPTPYPPVVRQPRGEWVVAPVPGYDPQQTWKLTMIAQYIIKPEAGSDAPPNIFGIAGLYTGEESVGVASFYSGSLDDDRWRVLAGGGYFGLNYDFYGVGAAAAEQDVSIPIEQDTVGLLAQVTRRIPGTDVFVGPRALYTHIDARTDAALPPAVLPATEAEAHTAALGLAAQWDTTDDSIYPTRGNLLNLKIDFFGEALGSDFDYQAYEVEFNRYVPLSERGVLALRGFGRYADGDVPFFDLSLFGQHNDLRGYESGKYRDRLLVATQAEYRHRLDERFGFVVFAGVGEVAADLSDLTADDLLWSTGAGLRFRIAKENPVDFRLDAALGEDGVKIYLGVGQAF